VNIGAEIQRWKEHFSGGDENKFSIPNIRNIIKKTMGQISNEDSMKPIVEKSKQIDTDMELYLIGPDKDTFLKNLQENRQIPTIVKTNNNNLDIDLYFGTNKKDSNAIVSML
jgi:hypothetical protein